MNGRDPYDAWLQAQRDTTVPEHFVDQVMDAASNPSPKWQWPGVIAHAALWAAAVLVLALRVGSTLAVLWHS